MHKLKKNIQFGSIVPFFFSILHESLKNSYRAYSFWLFLIERNNKDLYSETVKYVLFNHNSFWKIYRLTDTKNCGLKKKKNLKKTKKDKKKEI